MPRETSVNPRAPFRAAIILNLFLPGTGLILRRREWLGLSLAVLFGVCCNVAIAGWLIAPAAIPGWLTMFAVLLAAVTWLAAQVLFKRRGEVLGRREAALEELLAEADEALAARDITTARRALERGRAIDEGHFKITQLARRISAIEAAHGDTEPSDA